MIFSKNKQPRILNEKWKFSDRVIYILLYTLGIFFVGRLLFWWFYDNHIPNNFTGILHLLDFVIFTVLTYVVGNEILYEVFAWNITGGVKVPQYTEPEMGKKVAFLTGFVPGNEPYSLLERTLKAMSDNTYPHDTWVLDEGDDPKVKEICRKLGVYHFSRKGIEEFNQKTGLFKAKTKGGNYNSWLAKHAHNYDFIAQLDVDFLPRRDFLYKTLGYFKDENVAFVGTPQVYGNGGESWIAKGASEQSYSFYGPIQKGLYGKGMSLFIGANHVVRMTALKDIKGYAGHITEDHLTGIKFYANKWKSVYVPEILMVGEGPTSWDSYFSQQKRWAYGAIDILFKESHKHFRPGKLPITKYLRYLTLEHFYFSGLAQFLGICLLVLYFLFGINSASIDFQSMVLYYGPVFVTQWLFFVFMQRFYVDPQYEKGFGLAGRLLYISAFPVFLSAFTSVLFKQPLTYKVTAKGEDKSKFNLSVFYPHLALGSVTLFCLLMAPITGNMSPVLQYFALANTIFMYGFFAIGVKEKLAERRLDLFVDRLRNRGFMKIKKIEITSLYEPNYDYTFKTLIKSPSF